MPEQVLMVEEADAYSVTVFCRRNNVGRSKLYELWNQGLGPRYMMVGTRRLISAEAAADWRRQMEALATERA